MKTLKPKRFTKLKDAKEHTRLANENGQQFETKKFATKRKMQFFSGTHWDWMLAIS